MTDHDHPDPDDMSHAAQFWLGALYVTLALAVWALLYLYMPVITAWIERAR